MDDTVIETTEPPKTEKTEVTTKETEITLKEFKEAARLGRGVFRLVCDREAQKLTPYLDQRGFAKEDLEAIGDRTEESLMVDDILAAKRASFGIALEAATQVAEVRLPTRGRIREDLESLKGLGMFMRKGDGLREELMKKNPGWVEEQARKVIAKRSKKSPQEVEMTTGQADSWAQEQFQGAAYRLGRDIRNLEGYFGR